LERRIGDTGLTQASPRLGRVVVFAAHFAPHVGGVERFTEALWSRLGRRGWEVLIVTANTNGAAPVGASRGLRVLRVPAWQVLDGRVPLPKPSRQLFALFRGMVAAPPDVVVSNTRFFPTSAMAAVLARRVRRPLLHIEHGSARVTLGRPVLDRLTNACDQVAGGWVLHRADRCLAVSWAVADFLRTSFAIAGVGILSNGVETSGWERASSDYRQLLGVRTGDVLIVYVGRLIEAKGVFDLLEAFTRLDDGAGRRLHLAMAGDGPLAAEVMRRAQSDERIAPLGPLSETDVHDLLLAADVVVHPSAYPEGLPTVLLEAAAAGAAVIATAAGGTTELIEAEESGLIVPAHDPGALRDALARLVADGELRGRLGDAARRTVRRRFDWLSITDTLETELWKLRDGAQGPRVCHIPQRAV
jgi:glycosyltransferase involved in cell wall biosynthesis